MNAYAEAKAVSLKAWQTLRETCGGVGLELSQQDLCSECSEAHTQHTKQEEQSTQYRQAIMQQLVMEDEESGAWQDSFYVSKHWLRCLSLTLPHIPAPSAAYVLGSSTFSVVKHSQRLAVGLLEACSCCMRVLHAGMDDLLGST